MRVIVDGVVDTVLLLDELELGVGGGGDDCCCSGGFGKYEACDGNISRALEENSLSRLQRDIPIQSIPSRNTSTNQARHLRKLIFASFGILTNTEGEKAKNSLNAPSMAPLVMSPCFLLSIQIQSIEIGNVVTDVKTFD